MSADTCFGCGESPATYCCEAGVTASPDPCPWHDTDATPEKPTPCRCFELQAEVDHWRGLYEVEREYRTYGGTPLKPGERWTNVELPIEPEAAL